MSKQKKAPLIITNLRTLVKSVPSQVSQILSRSIENLIWLQRIKMIKLWNQSICVQPNISFLLKFCSPRVGCFMREREQLWSFEINLYVYTCSFLHCVMFCIILTLTNKKGVSNFPLCWLSFNSLLSMHTGIKHCNTIKSIMLVYLSHQSLQNKHSAENLHSMHMQKK